MLDLIQNILTILGLNLTAETRLILARGIAVALVIICALTAFFVVRYFLSKIVIAAITRTAPKWADIVVKHKVFHRLAYIAPAIVVALLGSFALIGRDQLIALVNGMNTVYLTVVIVLVIDASLNASLDIYSTFELSRTVPLKSFAQVIKIGVYAIAGFLTLSLLLNIPLIYLLSGLGALAAVGGFVFKDPILGFVAGIQLAANKMVAIGDWIEMPEYGANGDVLEINLTTVKVQNFDKTITTVPTYALISRSFKNWRGMQESGGRRIKRAVYIDISTIKFCTEEMLVSFANIDYVSDYISQKYNELADQDGGEPGNDSAEIEGKRLTNLGLFRAYVTAYLNRHPMINPAMMLMVRQLAPTEHGLPIEIYAFCKEKAWANYETTQSDIFDHILTIIPEFGLKVFQHPAGADFKDFIQTYVQTTRS